ncbi:MAG: hypothetical protein ABJN57_07830 [Hyphomicrobiales bacterium]
MSTFQLSEAQTATLQRLFNTADGEYFSNPGTTGIYTKLKSDVFKGQTFKVRAQNTEGKRVVTEVTGGEKANSAIENESSN